MSEQKQEVGFGLNYITSRTPAFAQWIFRAVLYTAASVNIVIAVVDEIPADTSAIIGKYSIYAVTLVHAFSKLFGLKVEDPNGDK